MGEFVARTMTVTGISGVSGKAAKFGTVTVADRGGSLENNPIDWKSRNCTSSSYSYSFPTLVIVLCAINISISFVDATPPSPPRHVKVIFSPPIILVMSVNGDVNSKLDVLSTQLKSILTNPHVPAAAAL